MGYEVDDTSNSTSLNYAEAEALLASITSDISSFSTSIKKVGADANYITLKDAGLDSGFINEFDTNIDNMTTSFETIMSGLSSAIANMSAAEDGIKDGMPEVPPDDLDETGDSDDVDDNPDNTVGEEDLETPTDGDTEEQNPDAPGDGVTPPELDNPEGEGTEEQNPDAPGDGVTPPELENPDGESTGDEQPDEQQDEQQDGNQPPPTLDNPTGGQPAETNYDESVFNKIDAKSLNSIFEQLTKLKTNNNVSMREIFTNKAYADKIKEIILSQPGLSEDMKNSFSSINSTVLQECFNRAMNTGGVDSFISLGYNRETALLMVEFINKNYVVK